ncbi:MAG: hypothetical protein IPG04_36830 [Polyangiaceae bacterium]|nr:hypothetical protein [Polyangiaceae bacterium]
MFLYTRSGHKVRSRARSAPETFLACTGFVVADERGFDASFPAQDLIEVGCNMHGRRYFREGASTRATSEPRTRSRLSGPSTTSKRTRERSMTSAARAATEPLASHL